MPPCGSARRSARSGRPRKRHAARRQHLVQQDRVAHAARDGAGGVERGRQRQAPSVGVSRCGVLEADQPVQRSRDADRAAACPSPAPPRRRRLATVTAPPEVEPPGMRGVASSAGVAGVGRRAMVRIDADAGEGELGQVGVADQRRAGCAQPRHRRTVGRGRRRVGHRRRRRRAGLRRPRRTGPSPTPPARPAAARVRRQRRCASTAAAAARAMASKRRTKACRQRGRVGRGESALDDPRRRPADRPPRLAAVPSQVGRRAAC